MILFLGVPNAAKRRRRAPTKPPRPPTPAEGGCPRPAPAPRAARKAPRPVRARTTARRHARAQAKTERVKVPSPPALKQPGYWMIQIEAGDGKGNHLPLFLDVFSTLDPTYQALGEKAWTRTFQNALQRVLDQVGRGGIWELDRGFDDVEWMNWMQEHVEQYDIRLKSNRQVRPGTKEAKAEKVETFARTLTARHTTPIRYVDKSSHKEKSRTIPFAWAPIWIDGVGHAQYLVTRCVG